MKNKFLLVFSILLILSIIFFTVNYSEILASGKSTLLAGTAKVNITPKVPMQMSGYGGRYNWNYFFFMGRDYKTDRK